MATIALTGSAVCIRPSTGWGRTSYVPGASSTSNRPSAPVVTEPPQSGCEARPVEGARLIIVSEDGDQVTTATTGADGHFEVDLAPGTYEVQPQPVEGLMHTAEPVSAVVAIGDPVEVTISYDTGIR